jgi:cysteine-rich repeat protein
MISCHCLQVRCALTSDGDFLTYFRRPGLVLAYSVSNSSSIYPQIRLQRRFIDGTVDVLFSCVLSPPLNPSQVKIRATSPIGSIYVIGQDSNSTSFFIWRIQANGAIDASWNAGAPVIVTAQQLASTTFSYKFDIVVASYGLFIISSNQTLSSSSGFVLKLTPLSFRDNSFGSNGLALFPTDASPSTGLTRAIFVEPSSLYLAGWRTDSTSTFAVVLKISSLSGARDVSFDATVISAPVGTHVSVDQLMYESDNSSIVVFGAALTPKATTRAFMARLDPILGASRCTGPTSVSWLDDGISSNIVAAVEVGGSYLLATDTGTSMQLTSYSARGQQLCTSLCGNAVAEAFEECDDGNRFGGDGCSAVCSTELAG